MSKFMTARKQLRAERAHQRALNRAAAQVSARSVRDEILKARTYVGM
ncbi:hypothetical protein AB0I28_05750 [Phytomonospora sp. NPDC050363]